MIGLQYKGNREEGISLILYRSYKTISISPKRPYHFTGRDDTSIEARRYYEKMSKLGVAVLEDSTEADEQDAPTVRTQPLEAEVDKQIDVQAKANDAKESQVAANATVQEGENSTPSEDAVPGEVIPSESDSSAVAEMSDSELSEYLEMNYNRDQLKELISKAGIDFNVGRKSEGTIINELVSNQRDKVVAYLAK